MDKDERRGSRLKKGEEAVERQMERKRIKRKSGCLLYMVTVSSHYASLSL